MFQRPPARKKNSGLWSKMKAPEGRPKFQSNNSVAPAGLVCFGIYPQLKLRAIPGRRDATWLAAAFAPPNYGESFFAVRLVSRFQRERRRRCVFKKKL